MSTIHAPAKAGRSPAAAASSEFITITIAGQLFGIPVLDAQDVLHPQKIFRIPMAPPEIAGALNLRGRIVTAIDVRVRLGLPAVPDPSKSMSVVTEMSGDLYSLLVDAVGEVIRVPADAFERNPATLQPRWRELCEGVYRLDGQLMLVLNVERILGVAVAQAA